MTTLTSTEARRVLSHLLKGATRQHKVYRIRYRDGDAVLLSEEDYASLLESLELLSIPGFRESMRRSVRQMQKGQTVSLDEALGDEG
jgi:antitoxin YefM